MSKQERILVVICQDVPVSLPCLCATEQTEARPEMLEFIDGEKKLCRKGSGTGRNLTRTVSKSNTLPIQISLTLVETLGGTTSIDLWFRSLSLLGGRPKEGRSRGTGRDPISLKHHKGEGRIAAYVVLNIGI